MSEEKKDESKNSRELLDDIVLSKNGEKVIESISNFGKQITDSISKLSIHSIAFNPPIFKMPKIPKPSGYYDKYYRFKENIPRNENDIDSKSRRIKELETKLNLISMPEHFRFGLFSLAFLTLVGVVLPILLLPVADGTIPYKAEISMLFIAGLSLVSLYFFMEVNTHVK